MTEVNKNYSQIDGTALPSTIPTQHNAAMGEIEADMGIIETDLTQAQSDIAGKANSTEVESAKDCDNHVSGTTNKVYTAAEQTKLSGITAGAEPNTVDSVAGKTGAVTLTEDDISDLEHNAVKIQGVDVSATAPSAGQYMAYSEAEAQYVPTDAGTPSAHASSHEDGGSDEISVDGLSGSLADPQTPTTHGNTHESGGVDELNIADLPGTPAELATHEAETSAHGVSGDVVGTTDTQTLTNKTLTSPKWNGWINCPATLTFSSYDSDTRTGTATTSANMTGEVQVGDRLTFSQATGGTKYAIITAIASGSVTFFMYEGDVLDNETITSPQYSHQKNPFGFDTDGTKWELEATSTTDEAQTSPTQNQWYNIFNLELPIGSWNVSYSAAGSINDAENNSGLFQATLSSGSTTESDSELTAILFTEQVGVTSSRVINTLNKQKTITVTSATTYYLNIATSSVGVTEIALRSDLAPSIIRAKCAYL